MQDDCGGATYLLLGVSSVNNESHKNFFFPFLSRRVTYVTLKGLKTCEIQEKGVYVCTPMI